MDSESDDELYNAVREYEADDYSEVSDIVLYNAVSQFEASALNDYDGSATTSRDG